MRMEMQFAQESRLLRTLAHPGRLAILASLRRGSTCVCHLAVALGRSEPYLSQQLAVLKGAGIIEAHREGAFTYYQLRDYGVLGLVDLTSRLLGDAATAVPPASAKLEGCGCPRCDETATAVAGVSR
jgi:DNA-binding transcriptional ArsR family regulator